MSETLGYHGDSLKFLLDNKIKVGDIVEVHSNQDYTGIVMPRFEGSDEVHIVLKLKSGYNVGLEIKKIDSIKKIGTIEKPVEAQKTPPVNPTLPNILLISTGGTIASRIDYRTGAVTPVLTAAELYGSVPELAEIANIETEVLLSEYSENITPDHWIKIAKRLDEVSKSNYKGIIIAHGTDTMQYTASFLSFALAGFPIPIALVGSQRSSDRASSDAALNLIGATQFLVKTKSNGVFVVMHNNESDDEIAVHLGTRVRKNHTSKRSAFQTIGDKPSFLIKDGNIEQNLHEKYFEDEKYTPRIRLDTKVALVKYHPGIDPNIVESLIANNFRAIILEGTGLGHVGKNLYDVIRKATEKGLFVGMSSQCIDGRIRMTVYESGRDLLNIGIVPLADMIPETALVKIMWALGNCSNSDELKTFMTTRIASEFSD